MSEHAPTLHLKPAELRPRVRAYADKLRAEILDTFRAARARGFSEWQEWLLAERRARRITVAEAEAKLERLQRLMRLLRETAQTGKRPIGERAKYEFDIEEYLEGVRRLGERWRLLSEGVNIFAFHPNSTYSGVQGIEEEIKSALDEIPVEAFEEDETIGQHILIALDDGVMLTGSGLRRDIGFLWSKIITHSLGSYDPHELEDVRQVLEPMRYDTEFLAWEWPGGLLEVEGFVGKGFAILQKGGIIRAEDVGEYAGEGRADGELIVDRAGVGFCRKMSGGFARAKEAAGNAASFLEGGEVVIGIAGHDAGIDMSSGALRITDRAGDALGKRQSGGRISARIAGKQAGLEQRGGRLEVGEAGPRLGQEQVDGFIRAKKAGPLAGYGRRGGKLDVEEADNGFCSYMKGGEARAILTGDEAGYKQEGGRIEVDEAAGTVALHQSGGEFVVNKNCAKIATNRTGGTVIFRGKKVV